MKSLKRGNQPLSQRETDLVVSKLEPYLKAGLSLRAACFQSGVSRSSLYRLMEKNEYLRDKIRAFQQYLSVIATATLNRRLIQICKKQEAGVEISQNELAFVMWFATHSIHCREEFGKETKSQTSIDPQAEVYRLQKMIQEADD